MTAEYTDRHRAIAETAAARTAWMLRKLPVADRDDLAQEAALALWRYDTDHPGAGASDAMAAVIARRACVSAVRRARGRGRQQDGSARAAESVDGFYAPFKPADPSVALDVHTAIDALNPTLKTAVARRLDGWRNRDEVAAGASPKTVETRVLRSFAQLREALSAYA